MKPAPFIYHDPRTVPEAVALLARLENAKLLAGGQSLMAMMNMRYAMPENLIDLNNVEGLAGIERRGDVLRIGAMTRQRDLEFAPDIKAVLPLMQEAIRHVGHRQTRNRGTIGGSLCHLDPAAELPAVCLAADATVHVVSARGERNVAMQDFALGFMTPAIEPDEIATAISLPVREGESYAFEEYARRLGDFALAGAAVLMAQDADGTITRVAIALCGVGSKPQRCSVAEAKLLGEKPAPALWSAAAAELDEIEPTSDVHASGGYRKHLASVLIERALARAVSRAGRKY